MIKCLEAEMTKSKENANRVERCIQKTNNMFENEIY